MASMGPFSICCLMAQYNMNSGSPAQSCDMSRENVSEHEKWNTHIHRIQKKQTNIYIYVVWNIIQTQSAHADQTPTLTLRNLWRRKANQFVSIFSATDSVLKWHEMRKKQGFSFMNPSIIHEIMTGSSGRSPWHLDTGFGCILFVEHSAHSE